MICSVFNALSVSFWNLSIDTGFVSEKVVYIMKNGIRFLVMDVDGTLTNGKIYMGENGELFKSFDIKDGSGIKDILPQYSIEPVIITARTSRILENRCRELNIIELHQGISNKLDKLDEVIARFAKKYNVEIDYQNIAYIGDDILDLQCMQPVKKAGGVVGCPADAVQEVIEIADFISSKNGGDGAVRDFIEWLIHR